MKNHCPLGASFPVKGCLLLKLTQIIPEQRYFICTRADEVTFIFSVPLLMVKGRLTVFIADPVDIGMTLFDCTVSPEQADRIFSDLNEYRTEQN